MLLAKKINIKGKDVEVHTLSFGGMMELTGTSLTVLNVMKKCMSDADWDYLQELEFENDDDEAKKMNELLQATIDLNSRLFKKTDFLEQKKEEVGVKSISGQQ